MPLVSQHRLLRVSLALLGAGLAGSLVASPIIPDANLRSAVASALSKCGSDVTLEDLQQLTCLSASHRQIASLAGLESATNLVYLDLRDNLFREVKPLGGLSQLLSLRLENNSVSDLSPLQGLTKLTCLSLGESYVEDYSALTALTNLTTLSIRNGGVQNLEVLSNALLLSSLELRQNSIEDLAPLRTLTNLTSLDLRYNSITNCTPLLGGPTNLTSLHLGGNRLSNPPSLHALQKLTLLNLDDNAIRNLSSLALMTNLTYLSLNRNPVASHWPLTNLTRLVNLELRANTITNAAFLQRLTNLVYVDLAYNQIKQPAPISAVTNLTSLVLGGNPLTNTSSLGSMGKLANLWLFNNSFTGLGFLSDLPPLNHLDLSGNSLSNIPSVSGLTNLTGLALGWNPISDFAPLVALTNLTSLLVDGCRLQDLSFLTALKHLKFLSLAHNRINDIFPLVRLHNLEQLYLSRNAVANLQPLEEGFSLLLELDLRQNSLDIATALPVIESLYCRTTALATCGCTLPPQELERLQCRRLELLYLPTNRYPTISAPASRYLICNSTSSIPVSVSEDPPPGNDNLVVVATSANTGLVQVVANPLPGMNYDRALTVATGCAPLPASVPLTVTVTDDIGLSASTTIQTLVEPCVRLPEVCSSVDWAILYAISTAVGVLPEELCTVDLLNLSSLSLYNPYLDDYCVWLWLTNLTTLSLSGNGVRSLDVTTNLARLHSLSLYGTSVTDLSPLTGRASLTHLDLDWNSPANYVPVLSTLTNLTELSILGNGLTNACFLKDLGRLHSLSLEEGRLQEVSCLTNLADLQYLDLNHNLVTNVSIFTNLPRLTYLDLRFNRLDLDEGSEDMKQVRELTERGVLVSCIPQRTPPTFAINPVWLLAANQPAWVSFAIMDSGVRAGGQIIQTNCYSENVDLIPNSALSISCETNDWTIDWFLRVDRTHGSGTATISLAATNDAGLGSVTNIHLTVVPSVPLTDGQFFGLTNVPWRTGGDAPWYGQSAVCFEGVPSAQTGSISNGQVSMLEADFTGPGTLVFWWRISSEPHADWLEFEALGNTNRISGETEWQQVSVVVPPRTHTVRWRYYKDSCCVNGLDAGWLAQVSFVPGTWLEWVEGPGKEQTSLSCYCEPGRKYELQFSTNLTDWKLQTPYEQFVCAQTNMNLTVAKSAAGSGFFRLRTAPVLSLAWLTPSELQLAWDDPLFALQSTTNLAGPWTTHPDHSPVTSSAIEPSRRYFRLISPPPAEAKQQRP